MIGWIPTSTPTHDLLATNEADLIVGVVHVRDQAFGSGRLQKFTYITRRCVFGRPPSGRRMKDMSAIARPPLSSYDSKKLACRVLRPRACTSRAPVNRSCGRSTASVSVRAVRFSGMSRC